MAAIVIFELLCVAGIAFMIRFLIALSEGRAKSRCRIVCSTTPHMQTEEDSSRFSIVGVAAFRKSDANSRPRFKVIAAGPKRPFCRVG
jgi:hypothetical protein